MLWDLACERIMRGMSASPLPFSARPDQPQLFRFGLRQMLCFVALLSGLCTLLVITGGPWSLAIAGGALLVAAHVLGNLIGTRLRDSSADIVRLRANDPSFDSDFPQTITQRCEFGRLKLPPGTPLADYGPVVGPRLLWFVVAGAAVGATAGGAAIARMIGLQAGWAGWTVGTISCAVLGTWLAFLASSFGSIARHAWRHASEKGR